MKKTQKTTNNVKKSHFLTLFGIIYAIFLIILLCGCAKKDPVETIVDNHSNHIDDVLDYTYNNFEQTIEIKFLENELEACKVALADVKQAHQSRIDTEKAKTSYWRLATAGLFIALVGLILVVLRRFLKII